MRVMIADDSELLRDRLRNSLLSIKNVTIVGEATNGIEALQIIQSNKPDFVILDVRMPIMSGIEVLEKIKAYGSKSTICIFTNYPYQQYKQKCLELGAEYVFDKNEDFANVKNLVSKLSNNYFENKHDSISANLRKKMIDNNKSTKAKIFENH